MELLERIYEYLREERMTPSRFGRLAANDSRLIGDIKRGRELRPATRARVLALIERKDEQ